MSARRNLPRSFEELAGLRARGLIRESTVEQGDNSGPIVQRQDEEAFASRWGLLLERRRDPRTGLIEPYLYTDLVSGSDAAKRPQFLQMVADAKAGLFDVLLVRETSRFARNWRQAGSYEDQLHDAGVVIAYISEGRLSSDMGEAAQLQLVFNHATNESYRRRLAVNVHKGYRVKRFERGKFSGSPPIGYVMEYEEVYNPTKRATEARDTGRLVPDTEPRARVGFDETYTNADLVRLIGELYASGRFGTRALAVHLNGLGYRTPVRPAGHVAAIALRGPGGAPFDGHTIRKIIENPTYAGFLSWHHRTDREHRDQPFAQAALVDAPWDPLWPRELWDRIVVVRARLSTGSAGGRARYPYPFRRIAWCDRCGGRLFGELHRGRRGEMVPYMACMTQRERKACDQRGVRASALDDQVGTWLGTLRLPADWRAEYERIQRGMARAEEARPAVDRARIEAQLTRLQDLYVMGDLPREEYVRRRRALDVDLSRSAPARQYSEDVVTRAARLLDKLGELWAEATPAERQEIVGEMFAAVRVRDDRIVSVDPAREEVKPLLAIALSSRAWLAGAPPDGLGGEAPTIVVEGLEPFLEALLAA
ncbi:MAG TPA: recombinase family protein [Candidatus Limnocylindrales bacterium]|jgi:DNA invertase Pin-like site-specific DNA recombinase|nr:recombinase family protein [Candidatus Limnocylindrales bacterium]